MGAQVVKTRCAVNMALFYFLALRTCFKAWALSEIMPSTPQRAIFCMFLGLLTVQTKTLRSNLCRYLITGPLIIVCGQSTADIPTWLRHFLFFKYFFWRKKCAG